MQEEAGSVKNKEVLEEQAAENQQETAVEQPENQEAARESELPAEDVTGEAEEEAGEEQEEERRDDTDARRSQLDINGRTALVEAVLFLESESQTVETLSKITKFTPEEIKECIDLLNEKYAGEDSGIELVQKFGGWMLAPKWDSFDFVKERYGKKNEGRLSRAAIETLSIIAYSQPITRAEIESIRHVNVDNMIRLLLERKFIKEDGKKDVPGKPVLYGTTKEFLEFFHLQSIAQLPQLEEEEQKRFELAR